MNNFDKELKKLEDTAKNCNIFIKEIELFKKEKLNNSNELFQIDELKEMLAPNPNNCSVNLNKEILYTYSLMLNLYWHDRDIGKKSCYNIVIPQSSTFISIDSYIIDMLNKEAYGVQVKTKVAKGDDENRIFSYHKNLHFNIKDDHFYFVNGFNKTQGNRMKTPFGNEFNYESIEALLFEIDKKKNNDKCKDIYIFKEFLVFLILNKTKDELTVDTLLLFDFITDYFDYTKAYESVK